MTVCDSCDGGSALEDGGSGTWTALARVVDQGCGGDSVSVRTDVRAAFHELHQHGVEKTRDRSRFWVGAIETYTVTPRIAKERRAAKSCIVFLYLVVDPEFVDLIGAQCNR